MRFHQYPTRAARAARRDGRERRGQFLSDAPGGVWIIPLDREPADPKVALLGHGLAGDYYVIESEQTAPAQ